MDSDAWQTTFLIVILSLVALVNMNCAIYQSGVMGVAGKFPYKYMGAVMIGQAIGGITPAVLNIVIISLDVAQKAGFFFAHFEKSSG